MRRTLLALAVTIFVVAGWPTSRALAQDNTNRTRGTVTSLGTDSVSVKARDQEMKFSVDGRTVVEAPGAGTKERQATAAGKAGPKLTEVMKTGQAVEVSYVEAAGGALRATRIRAIASVGSSEAKPSDMISSGTVKSVAGNSLTISGSSGAGATFTQSFTIDPSTRVVAKGAGTAAAAQGGRLVITDAVAAGDRVSVSYQEAGSGLSASEVRVIVKAPRGKT